MKQRLRAWGDSTILPITSVLVFNDSGQLLLLRRHADDLGGGKWGLPGGRLKSGETDEQAARRELFEETKLQPPTIDFLGTHKITMPHGAVHLTSYTVKVSAPVLIQLDPDEHDAYRWFTLNQLLIEPHILWGVPSILHDFHFIKRLEKDPTLADGSTADLLNIAHTL